MLTTIWAIARKDLKVFVADRRAMLFTFLVPIVIASFFGVVMSGSGDSSAPKTKIRLAYTDLDKSSASAKILAQLKGSDAIEPVEKSRDELMQTVKDGKIGVGIVLPAGFGSGSPKLELYYDPSKSLEKQVVEGTLMQTMGAQGASAAGFDKAIESATDPAVKEALRTVREGFAAAQAKGAAFQIQSQSLTAVTNKNADREASLGHIFAGMAVQGVMFFAIEAAMSLLREKRTGTWNRLRAAPIRLSTILVGRGLGSWMIGCAVVSGVYAFGILALGVRVYGSWPGMALIVLCTGLFTATFGLLVASLGKTEAQSRGVSILAVLGMSMLGGAWFPTFMMPGWLQKVSLAIPARWAVDGFDAVSWRGGPFNNAVIPALALVGFSALFALAAAMQFQRNEA